MAKDKDIGNRLNQNRQETLSNIQAFVENTGNDQNTESFKIKRQSLLDDTIDPKDNGTSFYTKAIDRLAEASDARNHISWNIIDGHEDGTKDLIRDAREAITTTKEQPEKYAAQYMNLCRAAFKIIDNDDTISAENKKSAQEQIKESADQLLEGLRNGNITEPEQVSVKNRTAFLVATIEDAYDGKKNGKVGKTLEAIKDFQFEDEHRHISTLSSQIDSDGKTRVISESSVMALGTIDEFQEMYDSIKVSIKEDKAVPKNIEVAGKSYSMDWYHDANPEIQAEIRKNIDDIASGNKVIMNQLIDVLPGAKNCYEKTTCVFSADKTTMKQKMTTMHSGAPSSHGKGDQKELTRLQVKQLNALAGGNLDINTLNSKVRRTENIEKNIEYYVKDAVSKEGKGHVTVQPFNILRHFTPRDNKSFNNTLAQVGKIVQSYVDGKAGSSLHYEQRDDIKPLAEFLTKRPGIVGRISNKLSELLGMKTRADKAREGLVHLSLAIKDIDINAFEHAINAAEIIDNLSFLDRNNKSSKISAEMSQVTSDLSEENGPLKKLSTEIGIDIKVNKILSHCKSGIDRTGAVMTHASHIAINDELGFNESKMRDDPKLREVALANLVKQTAASHTGAISGSQGGTIGCNGVKPETAREFSRDVFGSVNEKSSITPSQLLSRESAKGNKGNADKATLKIMRNTEKDNRLNVLEAKISNQNPQAKVTKPEERVNDSSTAVVANDKSQNKTKGPSPKTPEHFNVKNVKDWPPKDKEKLSEVVKSSAIFSSTKLPSVTQSSKVRSTTQGRS